LILMSIAIFFISCSSRKPAVNPSESYYNQDFHQAIIDGEKWLDEHPNDNATRIIVGDAAYQSGDPARAFKIWKPALFYIFLNEKDLGSLIVKEALKLGELEPLLKTLDLIEYSDVSEDYRRELNQARGILTMQKNGTMMTINLANSKLLAGDLESALSLYKRGYENNRKKENRDLFDLTMILISLENSVPFDTNEIDTVLTNSYSELSAIIFLKSLIYYNLKQYEEMELMIEKLSNRDDSKIWMKSIEELNN
jgi:tetratricopeptide (TPR) repeat protein